MKTGYTHPPCDILASLLPWSQPASASDFRVARQSSPTPAAEHPPEAAQQHHPGTALPAATRDPKGI